MLAATYSYRTQSLYVLDRYHESCLGAADEITCEARCEEDDVRIRFSEIGIWRGESRVIATFEADHFPRKDWLGSDLGGNVLFSTTNLDTGEYMIVRFNVDTGSFERLLAGAQPLLFPVLVDPNGYLVYVEDRPDEARGVRYPVLSGSALTLADLELLF